MERNSNWKRKNRRRSLVIALIIAIIIAIILAITLGVVVSKDEEKTEKGEICNTPECVHTASKILDWIDPTIEPCDDFYDFACGNFIRQSTIADDESSVSTLSVSDNLVVEQLRTLIEEPIRPNESKPFVQIKQLYKACMNKTAIEGVGLNEIKELIDTVGAWPVVEGNKWDKRYIHWTEMIYRFEKKGFYTDYLFSLVVAVDEGNSSKRIINIDEPFLVVSKEQLTEDHDNFTEAYYNYMTEIAILFGADKNRATKEMFKVLQFEIQLANITMSNEDRRDTVAMYNPITVDEMTYNFSSIPWVGYINELLSPYERITKEETVIINSLKYLTAFNKLINNVDRRTLANYLIWRTVASVMSYMPDSIRSKQLEFNNVLTGETEMLPRWKECVTHCSMSLDIAVNALYARNYFKEDARNSAQELVSNIRAEFRQILETVDWMDDETRRLALAKADRMTTHIGYPIELLDDKKLEEYYSELEVNEDSYLKASLNASLFLSKLSYKKLRLPVNKTEWTAHSNAAAVNAYYSPNENSIQFPAGILQGVHFNYQRPNYMNYGGIGFIIGHEITHGFDDEGRHYDADGNLADWWVPETEAAFVKKTQCIISQYGSYVVPEIGQKLNGISTQGENIADIGGIKQAYLAYDRLIKENGDEPRLPGLDYNIRQLFWISAANIWCSKTRPEELKQKLADDIHSPDRFRILGAFSNIDAFAKDFNCKPGSKMNPKYKCQLW